jgi:PTH1 family peptidyl-tRNA hydrolase
LVDRGPVAAADFLVVGLGNPGPPYEDTRHNLGFRVVDRLAERAGFSSWQARCRSRVAGGRWGGLTVVLAEPQTHMNRSGAALATLIEYAGVALSRTLVVHDDLDLPFARLRIRDGGGHGGHNGLRSILEVLGSGSFLRLKIGIGRPSGKGDVVDYVLSPFSLDEQAVLPDLVERAADATESIVFEGPLQAMNRFHSDL